MNVENPVSLPTKPPVTIPGCGFLGSILPFTVPFTAVSMRRHPWQKKSLDPCKATKNTGPILGIVLIREIFNYANNACTRTAGFSPTNWHFCGVGFCPFCGRFLVPPASGTESRQPACLAITDLPSLSLGERKENYKSLLFCITPTKHKLQSLMSFFIAKGEHTMITFEKTIFINRPQQEVFDFMRNLENDAQWRSLESIKRTSDGPIGAGSTWRETSKFLGREIELDVEMISYDPPNHFSVKTISGPIPMEITNKF